MNIDLIKNIAITDDDIDWVETVLRDIKFDKRRRDIIKNMETVDIQAFPGSGKTTVLVAKLAILAKKWPFSNRGICVLSHTNAARDEIEERLGNTDVGRKLLRYPHFIGTLHSFFDTYAGIPWLHSHGQKIKVIDSSIVKEMRWKRLEYGTRVYLDKKSNTYDCCQAVEFPIDVIIKGVKKQSSTYKKVAAIVCASLKKCEYTFDEMLLIAKKSLNCVPRLPVLIVNRFPLLFIDEAQDTYVDQWELLDMAFPPTIEHIQQCFGDCNQAIYQSYGGAENRDVFPRGTPLTLPDSMRFGHRIASFANNLAISREVMGGESTTYAQLDDMNTIFLFDEDNPQEVIAAYKSLVLSCFTDKELSAPNSDGCHVIGMVHNQNDTNEEHRPRNIHDYWEDYDAARTSRAPSLRLLVECFRIGNKGFTDNGEMNVQIDWIARGLRRYFNQYNSGAIPVSTNAFRAICNELSPSHICEWRKCLFCLARMSIQTEQDWQDVANEVVRIAVDLFGLHAEKDSFLDWKNDISNTRSTKCENSCTFHDDDTNRELTLHFGSIHSVKGRTHLSTLVVETFWYDPNIKSILPWLCGCSPQEMGIRNINRLKCHYVAFTRASALLCVAIPKINISTEQVLSLQKNGWRIVDLSIKPDL